MSSDAGEDPVEKAISECTMVQSMINFTSKHLDGLRTSCATTEELTQSQIRDTESKLVKLFSQQLIAKAQLAEDEYPEKLADFPNTRKWLSVVGIGKDIIEGIMDRDIALESLLEMSEHEILVLLGRFGGSEEETRRLTVALRNLNLWTERQLQSEGNSNDSDIELHWSSYKSASSSPHSGAGSSPKYFQQRPSTSSLPLESVAYTQPSQIPTPPQSTPSSPVPRNRSEGYRFTPPPTPSLIRPKAKYPSTPPPMKKMQLFPMFPLIKSKSHEEQLANKVTDIDPVRTHKKKPNNLKLTSSHEQLSNRRRLSTEGSDTGGSSRGPSGHTSPVINSPLRSPPYLQHDHSDEYNMKYNTLAVPRSPKSPYGVKIKHQISHKFISKIVFGSCDFCHRHVFRGKVCKFCKFKCHKDCSSRVPPACSLPPGYVDVFMENYRDGSPNTIRRTTTPNLNLPGHVDSITLHPVVSVAGFSVPDSSSNTSSCNSSSPSSPALAITGTSSGTVTSPSPAPSPHVQDTQFQFPDVPDRVAVVSDTELYHYSRSRGVYEDFISTNTSNDSDKTLVDSNASEKTLLDRVDSVDSQDDLFGHSWNRTNSFLKEWDIPYEDLVIDERLGVGRFGEVYRGNWHGEVAIKVLNMTNTDNQAQLSAFKLEVAMLRKTRHENLILFMGACMKPPKLAIVISYCTGQTLYTSLHIRKEQFSINKTVIIASQVCQGMGYLHSRGIIHKDLKTKNIFCDKGKVVITDFGLFTVTKLCQGNKKGDWLNIPPGWLCYLAQEIIRSLQVGGHDANNDLPFSEKSDVYAFGTVWYELLCAEWPYKNEPPESIIWQVGRGLKQSLCNINSSRDVKDILMKCWSYKPDDRPEFNKLLKALERLPKKRLIRSPSHPVHLSRSAESVFQT